MERFPLPLGAWDVLHYFIVALPVPSIVIVFNVYVKMMIFEQTFFEVEPVRSINTEPSKQSEMNILHFEKRIGDCVNATMCNDSKHHLIPKKFIPFLENHDLFVSDASTLSTNNIQDIYSFDFI